MHQFVSTRTVLCSARFMPRVPHFLCVCCGIHRKHRCKLWPETVFSRDDGKRRKPSHSLPSRKSVCYWWNEFGDWPRGCVRVPIGSCAISWIFFSIRAPVFAVESMAPGLDCCGLGGCGVVNAHAHCIPTTHASPGAVWVCVWNCSVPNGLLIHSLNNSWVPPVPVPVPVPVHMTTLGILVLDGSSMFTFACVRSLV